MPRATSLATTSGLNGRLALGISALPGRVPNTVWYHSIGHGRRTYEYLIGSPCRSRYGTTAVDSRARQSRVVNLASRVRTAPPPYGTVAAPPAARSSTSQSPSGSAVEK